MYVLEGIHYLQGLLNQLECVLSFVLNKQELERDWVNPEAWAIIRGLLRDDKDIAEDYLVLILVAFSGFHVIEGYIDVPQELVEVTGIT